MVIGIRAARGLVQTAWSGWPDGVTVRSWPVNRTDVSSVCRTTGSARHVRKPGKGVWDLGDRRIFTPKNYGWGYGINFAALKRRFTRR